MAMAFLGWLVYGVVEVDDGMGAGMLRSRQLEGGYEAAELQLFCGERGECNTNEA
jgi:hypothetical protein